jgi:hypothetical protein
MLQRVVEEYRRAFGDAIGRPDRIDYGDPDE